MTSLSLVESALDAYHELRCTSDRSPANERITHALSRLVADASAHRAAGGGAAGVCDHPAIARIQPRLYAYLAEAEGELERFEARALCRLGPPRIGDLRRFRYWRNYRCLVKAELARLRPHLDRERPLAFVGSGPLPLSPLLLHAATGLPVTGIDDDPEAVASAHRLVRAFGAHGVSIVREAGERMDYAPYQCVFVASLVDAKQAVLERVLDTASDPLIAVRTGEGVYELLYAPLDRALCERLDLACLARTDPDARTINTTHLLAPSRVMIGAHDDRR